MKTVRGYLLGAGLLGLLACQGRPGEEGPAQVTRHAFEAVGAATLAVGSDCTAGGAGACVSGLCLHAKPLTHAGYFCSQLCGVAPDGGSLPSCPSRWRCMQAYPGDTSFFCVPPADWTGQSAADSR